MKQNQKKYMKLVGLVLATIMALTILTSLGIGRTVEDELLDPPILYETQKLLASDGQEFDKFGHSVAIDDEIAVVGAHQNDHYQSNCGSAYIYHYIGSTWVEEQKLVALDAQTNDLFGVSVAIDGDLIVVGAEGHNGNVGAIYVYRYDGSTWVQEQRIQASDGGPNHYFGCSVAINNDVIVVGARHETTSPPPPPPYDIGAAYIYRFDGSIWYEEQKLIRPDTPSSFDLFGVSVAIDGDLIVVGAEADDWWIGAGYVYRYDGSTWVHEQKILASDLVYPSHFGTSVAIHNDVIIFGATEAGPQTFPQGAAYIYRYDGSEWIEEQKLELVYEPVDYFGSSVAILDDVAIVGAKYRSDTGSAYVYRYISGIWHEEYQLLASDGEYSDHFGVSVAICNNVAIVGADEGWLEGPGSTYVFMLPISGDINGDGAVNVDDLLILLDAWGPNPGHPADLNGDGVVNVEDLLIVLANWS